MNCIDAVMYAMDLIVREEVGNFFLILCHIFMIRVYYNWIGFLRSRAECYQRLAYVYLVALNSTLL